MISVLGNGFLTFNGGGFEFVFDADAQNYIIQAGITNLTQKLALNDLCLDLKAYGIWDQCIGLYPFIGGSASTHKYNLKNPQDTNASYRLAFSGTWVHSSTGISGNGTNTYANTFFSATALTFSDNHISLYSRTVGTNSTTETTMGGGADVNGNNWFSLFSRRQTSNNAGYDCGGSAAAANRASVAITDGSGFFLGKANSLTSMLYRNGSVIATKALHQHHSIHQQFI
mgnify:CR=1 FL=1